jgi:hypothetical protein
MALYLIHDVDHDDNICGTCELSLDRDEAAIEVAYRRMVPAISAGFEVWEKDRFVHEHRRRLANPMRRSGDDPRETGTTSDWSIRK